MRIILDQGLYDMRNVGNTAMLQMAAERLRKYWPLASIEIITYGPHLLKVVFPYAHPINPFDPDAWSSNRDKIDKLHQIIPGTVWRIFFSIREDIWFRWPKFQSMFRRTQDLLITDLESVDDENNIVENNRWSTEMVPGADLFVATGSQYITDNASEAGIQVLNRLEVAAQHGIPTVMVGQGIGPVTDPELRERAKAVLPLVDLIFVRERLHAPNILSSLGVDQNKVKITGDDAIELAYRLRKNELGTGIGVSMRVMPYTEVSDEHLRIIRESLHKAAKKHKSKLVSLPISETHGEWDELVIRKLLSGYKNVWQSRSKFIIPVEAIKNTARCRLVVTGTFHAAVFALAQGIPVVCLVKGASYVNKLSGLADLFTDGCQVIGLDDENFQEKLNSAIDNAWQSADRVRPKLLDAASRQIDWGQKAYNQIIELIDAKDNTYLAEEKIK